MYDSAFTETAKHFFCILKNIIQVTVPFIASPAVCFCIYNLKELAWFFSSTISQHLQLFDQETLCS